MDTLSAERMGTAGKGKGKDPLKIMLGRCKAFTEEGILPMGQRKKARSRYLVFGIRSGLEAMKMVPIASIVAYRGAEKSSLSY